METQKKKFETRETSKKTMQWNQDQKKGIVQSAETEVTNDVR